MNEYLPYTGGGADGVPPEAAQLIEEVSYLLASQGHTLRVGGHKGASKSFSLGVASAFRSGIVGSRPLTPKASSTHSPLKEVYLPYRGYEGYQGDALFDYPTHYRERILRHLSTTFLAGQLKKVKSNLELSDIVSRAYQLLGTKLNRHSKFVLCWTPDAATKYSESNISADGFHYTIALAEIFSIPVYNINKPTHRDKIVARVNEIKSGTSNKDETRATN